MVPRAGRTSMPEPPCRGLPRGSTARATRQAQVGRRRGATVRAFTLIEAMVAIALAALAGSVLLAGLSSSLQTTDEALKRTIAAGIAEQLLDEILGNLYCDSAINDPYQVVLGASAWEKQGTGRERFNDIDDFHGVRTAPPADPWGVALGIDDGRGGQRHEAFRAAPEFLQSWQQRVDVYYVAADDLTRRLTGGATSDYRAVDVRIVDNSPSGGGRELARLRRVVAYVPPPQ